MRHFWVTIREYVTHWIIAGIILSLTGFVPEEWFARAFHGLALPEAVGNLWPSGLDPRLVVIVLGVGIIVGDLLLRRRASPHGAVTAGHAAGLKEEGSDSSSELRSEPALANAPRLSIVVLPFENPSGDAEQEYFADGITEDLTTDLSRISGSFVVAAKTALTFKGKAIDVKEIGRQLGVRYALEGSVRRMGNQIRVNAQLIDAASGAHLWADRFDGDMSDLARLQDEVTARLARSLDAELVAAESSRGQRERPDNPDAVDLTMRGRAALNKPLSQESLTAARRLFEQALAIDGEAVAALVGLAEALSLLGFIRRVVPPAQDTQRAYEVATRALAIQPDSAAGYYALGFTLRMQKKHDDASEAFEKAIALNRNFAPAYAALGHEKTYLGRCEETFDLARQAMRLSPRDPNLAYWMAMVGFTCHFLGRDDEAIEWERKSIIAAPGFANAYLALASAYAHKGRLEEAHAALATHNKLVPNMTLAKLRDDNQSDNPVFFKQRERLLAGLKLAGMPEN